MADLAPERIPIDPTANFPSRAFLAKTMLHLPDWSQIDLPEHERRIHETFGVNSVLYLPLLRGDECIGLLAVGGRRANIFGPSDIAQAESFRDQALIAMENARLFNETQEALEHQKASGEVLRAIAQSVADTTPVFENILDASQRLFGSAKTEWFAQPRRAGPGSQRLETTSCRSRGVAQVASSANAAFTIFRMGSRNRALRRATPETRSWC